MSSASSSSAKRNPKRILLFDVDGTLTVPRKVITKEMADFMKDVSKESYIAIVGGSDLDKQYEQLGANVLNEWDYVFPENGLVAFKKGEKIAEQDLKSFIGDEKLKPFLNFILHYVADLDIPVKRGTFIEFRTGMINVSPVGRNCSRAEREAFNKYDEEHKVREKFVAVLEEKFADLGFKYSIGGQISFDVFPVGWDKTFCLKFLEADGFEEIHFFGDKTAPGGNDHEIFESPKTIGHTVTSPADTRRFINEILGRKQ
eukprot:TRINITY_DN65896_c9_g1_i1.p2 TRINITY_DN65896_c9_g1~~TRINITY_DN65896_c9_g1_i1.p2  ORF type:complete len:258 (-),score=157.35 TRINITY_DN65896_c9_g1_i1:322-1095(-)